MAREEDFLSRWSRRKRLAKDSSGVQPEAPVPAAPPAIAPPPVTGPAERPPLPPVESLSPQSDFAPFMTADVEVGLQRQALKKLFSDPRFNVPDMLDVYMDDYSLPDPLPEGWLAKLEQMSSLGDKAGRDRAEKEGRAAPAAGPAGEAGPAADLPLESAAPASVPPAQPEAPADPGKGQAKPT